MRKIILAATAMAALAVPAISSAATLNADGSGYVSKGGVQTVMGWNNSQFDQHVAAGDVNFTLGTGQRVDQSTYTYRCGGNEWSYDTTITWARSTTKTTPVFSANGKQITGWNLTAGPLNLVTMDPNGQNAINAFNAYNQCKQAGGTDGGVTSAQHSDGSIDGLSVNGSALPVS